MTARTFGTLSLVDGGDKWQLDKIEPHVSIRLKQLFPRIPKYDVPPYTMRNDLATTRDLHWFLDRYPLAMSDADRDALVHGKLRFEDRVAEMERILLPEWRPTTFAGIRPGQSIRDYQAVAVELLARSGGLLVGDECGLGKTYEGAAACLIPGALPAVIVCQVHIQKQWVRKLEEFTTLRVHAITKARPYDLPEADVYVFRYSQIAGWTDVFDQGLFRAAIYDEPQELRTGLASQKGCGARVLSRHATFRMGLTATPIYGYGIEIWNVMQFINADVLGAYEDFYREWVNHNNGKLADPKALGTHLREQYAFLRRTKRDVGRELAPVNKLVHYVDYDAKAVRSIEDLARQLAVRATTASFTERGKAARELDLLVRQATGISKAKQVAAFVRMLIEGGAPVLLFGWHREVYRIWMEELRDLRPVLYTGTESPTQKAAAAKSFIDGETDLLIMSLRSAAGLDGLQARCSTVVFGEFDWSPGIHHQCVERVDRDGQTDPVTAIFLAVDEGSDPPMIELLGLKASEASAVVDPMLDLQQVHSDETRLQALARRYLSKRSTQVAA